MLLSLVPVAVFLVLTRVTGPSLAVFGGFLASAGVFYLARRDRLIGLLTLAGFAVLTASAVVGIVKGSERAYLASGPISDFLFVPLYFGSLLVHRPLVGGIARELVPAITRGVPLDAPVYRQLSLAWAIFDVLHGSAALVLLNRLSVAQYVVWSRVLLWPFTGLLLAASAGIIWESARRSSAAEKAS